MFSCDNFELNPFWILHNVWLHAVAYMIWPNMKHREMNLKTWQTISNNSAAWPTATKLKPNSENSPSRIGWLQERQRPYLGSSENAKNSEKRISLGGRVHIKLPKWACLGGSVQGFIHIWVLGILQWCSVMNSKIQIFVFFI